MHLAHQGYLTQDYNDMFESVMREDLCPRIDFFKNTTTYNCSSFISGSLSQGLHVVFVRYFETLRNMLNMYQNLTYYNNQTGLAAMFNEDAYYELCKDFKT